MKKTIATFALFCVVIAGCTYYQTAPGYYGPGPAPASSFDRSWSAAVGAFEDRGCGSRPRIAPPASCAAGGTQSM